METVAAFTLGGLQQHARKTTEVPPRVAVYDVIAMVKKCDSNYAGQTYLRLLEKGPGCEEVDANLVHANCMDQTLGHRGGNRKKVRVATAQEMVQIMLELPGDNSFKQNCAEVITRYLGGDTSLIADVIKNRQAQDQLAREDPDNLMRLFGEEVESRGPMPNIEAAIASAIERGVQQGLEKVGELLKSSQAVTNERLGNLEEQMRKIPEYGPRMEMSRPITAR